MKETLLGTINSPLDLSGLSIGQLEQLAAEIREKIIDTMAINGGHLASNLGVVELTLALHKVFSSPSDKLLFDVSHQTYVHKLLTGRRDQFSTVRKYKGLCGFANPKESPHDHFYAGHAGTALSLGLGVAHRRDLQNENFHVIPIIGDATLTCGVTLEALNNIPKDLSKFILILNDNQMSISNNVGAITNILSRIINHPRANKLYEDVEHLLGKVSSALASQGHRVRESLKSLVSCAPFFEEFGLSYVGKVDGHDIKKLIEKLEAIKNSSGPVILHVSTVKGHGMNVAEQNPITWHGCSPFDRETYKIGTAKSPTTTFPKIFGKHLLKMADSDPKIVAVTPAMPAGSCLTEFMQKHPKRCLDVGIAEGHSVAFCGGLGYESKLKVVASIYATFLQRGLDNLFQDVCLQGIPVLFAIDRGGFSPADGSTHHGIYEIAFLNAMPGMVIAQPRNGHVMKELMESAFSWKRPTAIRYPNMATDDSEEPLAPRILGKAELLARGEGVAIIALGHMCGVAMQVRAILAGKGINLTVVDPVFVKPLDTDFFTELAKSHKFLVTLEEHALNSGLGMIFNSFLVRTGLRDNQVINLGIPDIFIEQGTHKELSAEIGLDPETIAAQIESVYKLVPLEVLL